jgi:Holliday junction DNA helicase RuvA
LIAFVEGIVSELLEDSAVIQAGPVGLEIISPKTTLIRLQVGVMVRLYTHLVIRDDSWALYGFHEKEIVLMFRHLISVSGVGPKLGVAMLSTLDPAVIGAAILKDDPALLSSAPGIGKRTAERIVLDLKNKVSDFPLDSIGQRQPRASYSQASTDAVEALTALGYRESQVKAVVTELALAMPEETAEGFIRKGLAKLR